MKFNDTMTIIRRQNYRFKVIQEGGKFIEVKDWNEIQLNEQRELDKIQYNRDMGYSGFDEDHGYHEDDI